MSPLFIIQVKKCDNYKIPVTLLRIRERKKWNRKIKKMCRAGGKSRARQDQNHIIFFYLALQALVISKIR